MAGWPLAICRLLPRFSELKFQIPQGESLVPQREHIPSRLFRRLGGWRMGEVRGCGMWDWIWNLSKWRGSDGGKIRGYSRTTDKASVGIRPGRLSNLFVREPLRKFVTPP